MPDIGPQSSWWELISLRASLTPERVMALDERGRSLTFAGLATDAERVAAALSVRGIGPGAVVSWQLPTILESLVLSAALSRLGAVQNPILPILRDSEVDHIIGQVGAGLLVTPAVWRGFDYAAMGQRIAARHGVETLVVDHTEAGPGDLMLPMADSEVLGPPKEPERDEVRWVYYSSGTTAAPKGARHSDASVMAGSNAMVELVGMREDDVFPMAYPVTHIGGHTSVTAQLRVGCRLLLIEIFDPLRSSAFMAHQGATILGSAPPFFHAYLAAQRQHGEPRLFANLRMGMSGGAPSPAELHFEVKRELGGAGIVSGWGLTEFPIATEASPDDPDEVLANTVGRAARGVTIRVVGPDGSDQPAGVEGELRVHGPQMCLGYVDASLDRDAFDEHGFFVTGDLGVLDPAGNLRITGRIKDIIIRNAENISAVAVEDVLYRHPDIADVAVVGIPDPRTGERCCAAIVMATDASPLTLDAVAEHCRAEGLAPQRIPERIDIVEALPRNAMGKLLKQEIRALVIELAQAGTAKG